MCKIFKIDKTRTISFHPQSGGLAERFNVSLEDMLSKVISRDQKDWDECLPLTMLAYRSSVHKSTKQTQNLMIHGREAQLPIDLLYGPSPDEAEQVDPHGYVDRIQQRLWKIHQKARDKMAVASTWTPGCMAVRWMWSVIPPTETRPNAPPHPARPSYVEEWQSVANERRMRQHPVVGPTMVKAVVDEELPHIEYWAVAVPEESLTEL
ncbi:unnamed protein product [Mytilus coruscus]|uniref:Integrase catalytic domain-containing protein n=1 Tax=Mytilus coruscus TaxID=42192 RepID=A0A6J8DID8_MYTCO|nr:unnamed protein product [Mytilus coruscus]